MFRRNGRGRVLLLVFLALCIVLITLDFRQDVGGPLKRAKELSVAIVTPIQRGFTAVFRPVGNFFSSIGDLANLRDENAELKARLEDVEAEIAGTAALEDENVRLRAQLELEESWRTMRPLTAEIIGKTPSNYKWAITIDKGRAHGVRPDMPVLAPDGLVGKVINAQSQRATILLLIDPQAAAGARVEGAGDTGVVQGNGAGERLTLAFIANDAEVDVGDEVSTSGQAPRGEEPIFPAGIPIGIVALVGADDRALEKDVEVMPAVDFDTLQFVTVLLGAERRLSSVGGGS